MQYLRCYNGIYCTILIRQLLPNFPKVKFIVKDSELVSPSIVILNTKPAFKILANQISLTVDVEDYYHAASLSKVCPIKSWHQLPNRVSEMTFRLLDIFDKCDRKGTFFVLGYSAKHNPEIVREIVKRGHEVASHGYAHRVAYEQTQKQFFKDVDRSKKLLEDLSGQKVLGYRAPNFSITDKNLWAYDELSKAGYHYDSSLNPVMHHRYGNIHRSVNYEVRETKYEPLLILPMAIKSFNFLLKEVRVPIAGGAYWRFFPEMIIKQALKKNLRTSTTPIICYLHPWEMDFSQPYFTELPLLTQLRHYYGIRSFSKMLESMMSEFSFTSIAKIIS